TGATGAGQLTVGSLTMSGGSFAAATAGSSLILKGNVTATNLATISGTGTLSLGGATRTITVNPGTQTVGLDVAAGIVNVSGEGIIKSGTGVLKLDANSVAAGYTGLTTISQGNVQVDGRIANVALNGGTLSGVGTVGTISGASAAGTVSPGDNGAVGI